MFQEFHIEGVMSIAPEDAYELFQNKGEVLIDVRKEDQVRPESIPVDNVLSNTLSGQTHSWNNAKEGKAYIAGIQYQPVKTINFSISYQPWDVKEKR